MDADTQAAAQQQAGTPDTTTQATEAEVKPKEGDVADSSDTQAAAQQTTQAVETPNPDTDDGAGDTSESASADSADLDMTKTEPPSQEEVDAALANAGFSNEDLGKELVDNGGKLTPETVRKLKEHFPEAAVDNAVADMESKFVDEKAGVDEKVAAQKSEILDMNNYIYGELAGGDAEKGKENLTVLSEWAKSNIDKSTLEVINAKLASGNKAVVREGLEHAVNLWKKGQERPMMTGDSSATNNQKPVEKAEPLSRDGYIKLQMSEKYQSDPEYAAKIDARRRASMAGDSFMTPEYNAKYRPSF
jgi:hypothetical protein